MKTKTFNEIIEKVKSFEINEKFDVICGIMNGGVIPAYLIAEKLKTDLVYIKVQYRDENNKIIFETPKVRGINDFDFNGKKVLIVDDRSKTGATLNAAKNYFSDAGVVKTLVFNGKADYFLYNEDCFLFPWKVF